VIDGNIIKRTSSLREQAYSWLKEQLAGGAYSPGEKLTESSVSQSLGISRTPAREALALLAQDGLLTNIGASGFSIPMMCEGDIREVFEVRFRLEPYAIKLATPKVSMQLISQLTTVLAKEADALGVNATEFTVLNAKFWTLLIEAIPQPTSAQQYTKFWGLCIRNSGIDPDV